MGLAKDYKQAFSWFQRGYDLGDASCTSGLGVCYDRGDGVEQEEAYAVHLYTAAACRGSANACYCLAECFAEGCAGLRKNARAATRWYRAVESAEVDDLADSHHEDAAAWLRENAVES